MSTGPEPDDHVLLDELAALLHSRNEPPPEVLTAAREIFTWRTVDAEIAALTYDSLLDDAPVAVRAVEPPRILTFAVEALTIEVEMDSSPLGRRLLGQLVPAQAAELELRSGDDILAGGSADELGRFVLALPHRSRRVALRCRFADGTVVETASAVI